MRTIKGSQMVVRALGLALALSAAMPAAAQTWQATGPDGGSITNLAGSSSVLLADTPDGLFRSTDRAENWQPVPAISQTQSIVISPHDPNLVIATSGRNVSRSLDGGATWSTIDVGTRLYALLFNPIPAQAGELLAIASSTAGYWVSPRLMRSVDNGATWQALTSDASFEPLGMAIDPRDNNYIAVLRDDRVMFSINRGVTWDLLLRHPTSQGPLPSQVLVVPGAVALLWSSGGWVSNLMRYDNFETSVVSIAPGSFYRLFADPLQSGRIWSAAAVEASAEWLDESLDFGETWTRVPSDRNARLQTVLADGTMIGSSAAGVLMSTDAGRHWRVRTRGIRQLKVGALAGHRSNDSLIAITQGGAWVSADRGMTWQESIGIPENGDAFSSVDRHPRDPAIALASIGRQTNGAKAYRTTDGGLSWQALPGDLGLLNAAFSIAYDRADPSRVSATDVGRQLFWSQDGGLHWQQIQSGVAELRTSAAGNSSRLYGLATSGEGYAVLRADRPGEVMAVIDGAPTVSALAVHPSTPHVLMAVAPGSGMVPVYLSIDGGDSWQPRGTLVGFPGTLLAFDACDDRTVYAFIDAGFYRSRDRGLTWSPEALDTTVRGATAIVTRCAGGRSHVAVSSRITGSVRVRSPVATERIATNDFELP